MSEAKSFDIAKLEVWDAYKRVKANRGAVGVDEVSIDKFDQDLGRNLYCSGQLICRSSDLI